MGRPQRGVGADSLPPHRLGPERDNPPPVLGLPPTSLTTVRGRRAPPRPNARRAGEPHVPAPALAHGR